jgi:S-disulfanyl-L-cysteine oxidoreductase SoxD
MPRKISGKIFLLAPCFVVCSALRAQTNSGKQSGLGRPASAEELKQRDMTTLPNGAGLRDGKGTAAQGEAVYRDKCASCHGPNGEGVPPQGTQLVGGVGSLASDNPVRTVGSYWPYATSVWDYIHRAMPLNQPGSLSADDTYAVTAFLLNRNKIIEASEIMDKESLPKVRMPNRDGFITDARPDVRKNSARADEKKNQKSNAH